MGLNAFQLVNLALNWTTVPKQRRCHFKLNFNNGDIPSKRHFKLNFTTDACQSCAEKNKEKGVCKNAIKKLEHVKVEVTLKHRRRGDLKIMLISPHGTVSNLLEDGIREFRRWTQRLAFHDCVQLVRESCRNMAVGV